MDESAPRPTVDDPFVVLTSDHLTTVTRGQKRALLIIAATALVVFWSGMMPESIPSLGIATRIRPKLVFAVLAGVDLYFLVTFVIYWMADYWTWQRDLRRSIKTLQDQRDGKPTLEEAIDVAMRISRGDMHPSPLVRWITKRCRPLLESIKVRAPSSHLKVLFDEFTDQRIGIWKLAWAAAPSSWLRLFVDGIFPAFLGVGAAVCMFVRFHQTR
jgi:hypothetical protein